MPCFYRINRFCASGVKGLAGFLKHLAPSRIEHLRHIGLSYHPRLPKDLEELREICAALSACRSIRDIQIHARDKAWWSDSSHNPDNIPGVTRTKYPKNTEPKSLSHIADLVKVAKMADEVIFKGDCPRIETHVRTEMQENKAKAVEAKSISTSTPGSKNHEAEEAG